MRILYNTRLLLLSLVLALGLFACQRAAEPVPDSSSPTEPVAVIEPTEAATALASPVPAEPTAVIEAVETAESPAEVSPVTEPRLLPWDWNDRSVFASGLIESETAVLDRLEGASIYHIVIDLSSPMSVAGQQEVRYTNLEETALEEIYFHLFPKRLGGDMEVSNVTVDGMPVAAVEEGSALRVPLTEALARGDQVTVGLDFLTVVPEQSTKYNVLAYEDDILALAHFYPMVAVYDDEGWNTEPSPPNGDETYADMSFYLVEVTAPAEQTVVASGVDVESAQSDGEQTVVYAAGPMRDFYVAMSDNYTRISQQVGPVEVNSYAPAELQEGSALALDVAAAAVEVYSERFGAYPYSELDIVTTPTLALGIEYPGIFANAVRIYDLSPEASGGRSNEVLLESTTAHETAHQWFYNLVGNDQIDEPWLDEALTQYATWLYFADRYGEDAAEGFFASLVQRWRQAEEEDIPIGLPAGAYSPQAYGAIVYGRGPIFVNELAETMGRSTFNEFIRAYVETYRWEIATTAAFQALAEEYCNCELDRLFEEWVY